MSEIVKEKCEWCKRKKNCIVYQYPYTPIKVFVCEKCLVPHYEKCTDEKTTEYIKSKFINKKD